MTSLKYLILNKEDESKINWDYVIQNSSHQCRWNKAKTQFILKSKHIPKWYINKPVYTLNQMKEKLSHDKNW